MRPEDGVTAFAPATVGNVICGFDVFGLALETPGDRVTVQRADGPGIRIARIRGDSGRLPTEPARNSATVAIASLLREAGRDDGLEVSLEKGLPLSGGMGGSAASAVAGVLAADTLLGTRASEDALLRFALDGESAAAGSAHLDNVAPALLGGLLLVRPGSERCVVPLPVPEELFVALLHPEVELSTREGRAALGDDVALSDAVAQWGNTAAFVHALHERDWDLLADALVDRVAEPVRSRSIPGFKAVRQAARSTGALACGISGAGPSMFSLCVGRESAEAVGDAMLAGYGENADAGAELYVSPISPDGARLAPASEVGIS